MLLKIQELLDKFKIPLKPKEYAIVVDAIPESVLTHLPFNVEDCVENIDIVGTDLLKEKCSNKNLRNT